MADKAVEKHTAEPELSALTANEIDVNLGQKLRQRRLELGLSQTDVAEGIELTFQQIQKYERGINRISASRLFDLSKLLKVKIEYFYEELPGGSSVNGDLPFSIPEVLELVGAIEGFSNERRLRLRSLLAAVA